MDEEDFEYDEGSQAALAASNQQRQVVKALEGYAMAEPEDLTASHRIHIHLFQAPAAVLTDDNGHVRALRTERTRLTGDGNVTGTGEYRDWPVQAVYRDSAQLPQKQTRLTAELPKNRQQRLPHPAIPIIAIWLRRGIRVLFRGR